MASTRSIAPSSGASRASLFNPSLASSLAFFLGTVSARARKRDNTPLAKHEHTRRAVVWVPVVSRRRGEERVRCARRRWGAASSKRGFVRSARGGSGVASRASVEGSLGPRVSSSEDETNRRAILVILFR